MRKRLKLSWSTFGAIGRVTAPFFRGEKRRTAFLMVGALLGMLFVINGISVVQSYIARDFINALSQKREADFYQYGINYIIALAVATIFAVLYRYVEERLALTWREWLTGTLVHRYLTARNYYRFRWLADIDNPDQRIAEDVKNFTATSLSLFLIILNSLVTLIAFSGVLASISTRLVWALVIYTIVGTALTLRIGRRLVRIHNRQYAREANFRYGLVRVRDNAESVAFYRGERREKLDLGRRFRDLVRNTRFLISWNRNLSFFTTGYNNFSLVLPTLVVAPLFLRGDIDIGVVTQAGGAFAQVLAATSILISQFERVSAYAAGVNRLERLWKEVNAVPDDDVCEIDVEEGNKLVLSDLTIRVPGTQRDLVKELTVRLKPGKGILIMGGSGSGKSSILRTVAGLWSSGEGLIQRPNHRDMMFLPQKPYMPPGNLRAQLLYPFREREDRDKQLKKVLKTVNLSGILERVDSRLDTVLDWSNVLSLGEQQRISFARLFVTEPSIVFLDEATSALDEENEKLLYGLLREFSFTFVSVGHRSTLMSYHDTMLVLDGKGGWTMEELPVAA